jgi:hypothetical protein
MQGAVVPPTALNPLMLPDGALEGGGEPEIVRQLTAAVLRATLMLGSSPR